MEKASESTTRLRCPHCKKALPFIKAVRSSTAHVCPECEGQIVLTMPLGSGEISWRKA